ncbi:MAG: hypothetical protein HZY79_08185 [Rhodoblastus sp.]|nr:MAG: hypothetical protein HZY79_08185 [Rhodoblastus sp.]
MECKIKISELRSVINTILDNLEIATEGGAVVVERDMYWEIFSHEKHDIRKMPVEFGIGQLFDDWNF